ncbi:DEAD/DEAH box helicase [Pedosphaera parvula]|uniref:DEAD-box ATP-dependent RNA helicase RhpA n=1 Tax=Pedosphaera parvula (strain Ellin514) TaxID=320771 RepID=B9XIK0_PEDPL|nr:DEAD/DEAH box helicase [Pedosphaera parvula]EEF60263.1 DEAD/DEAH box helicase domain protein [Pedosphaera parvula Ellin514]
MTTKLFSELGLSAELQKAIDKMGFEQASPIQAEAIPVLLQGRDVVGQSQTGSGKTAAFAVPAIEKVDPQNRSVQILILCPTRELAVQVSEEVHKLSIFKRGIHALPIYGGQSYERQFMGLRQGAQIVIGTPGRVMDHMRRGTLRLDQVKMVILDEADVMLDMGFREDIEFILQAVPTERQTVFFSATMPRPIQELIQKYARDPQSVRIEQKAMTVPTVEQFFYEVDRRFKVELLTRLIDIHDLKLGIVFCNTKRMVDDLVDHLNAQGYSADRLHGDMSQAMRDRVMNKFRKSGLEFLVATDVAARGIDVDDVQVVFNYDLPYDAEDYVHRIGRTGRAGRSGRAISFVAGRELFQIQHIERFTKMKIQRAKIPTADEVETARANVFLDKLRGLLQGGEYKKQDHLVSILLEEGFNSTDIASALIHQLQAGEAAPAKTQREEERERPERPTFRERRDDRHDGRADRPSRFSERREERPRRPDFSREARPEPVRHSAPLPKVERKPIIAKPEHRKEQAPASAPAATEAKPAPVPPSEPSRPKPAQQFPFAERREKVFQKAAPAPKHSRRTPDDFTRLYMSVGGEMGVGAGDVVGAILGETGLPAKVVGTVDVRERHLFVDVASEHANSIISKLNRSRIKNQKLKVKLA